uniref:Cytochrome P450 n=1 Tax=Varanus komodoensis TaxID=61221 RepID=A0A8D2L690_VARKO
MELSGTVTVFLALYLTYLIVVSIKRGVSKKGNLPPGPTPLPVIGNFLQLKSGRTIESLLKLREKYGPVFTVYFGNRPVVVLCGHEAVKEALIDKAEEFRYGELPVSAWAGEHLRHRWKLLRRFSLTVLRNFGMGKKSIEERIQEEAQFLLEEFQKTRQEPFDPTFFLSRAVSNIICSIVFGDRFDYGDQEFQALLRMMNDSFREMSTPWAQFYDMYANILKFFPGPHTKIYDLLEEMRLFIARKVKRNQETLDPNAPRDFIDCFLIQMDKEKGNPASEFNLPNLELTTLNLFFAGTETVSSTLRYGFLLLMKYPEVQGGGPASEGTWSGRGFSKRPFCWPWNGAEGQVPLGPPRSAERHSPSPQGTEIYPMLTSVLHDPSMFKTPDTFNPGHFLDESGCFRKTAAFVPFSSGKRLCLGEGLARMELFLFFTTILQRFRLKPLLPPQDISLAPREKGFATIPPFYKLCIVPR